MVDIDTAYRVLVECSGWLRDRGINEWQPLYPRHRFEGDVAAGTVYLFERSDGRVLGTVTLTDQPLAYHPVDQWDTEVRSWYLSRFAVVRSLAGQGIGARLLHRIREKAVEAGIAVLRLDCSESNSRLVKYYRDAGFTRSKVGLIHGARFVFAECPVHDRSPGLGSR